MSAWSCFCVHAEIRVASVGVDDRRMICRQFAAVELGVTQTYRVKLEAANKPRQLLS